MIATAASYDAQTDIEAFDKKVSLSKSMSKNQLETMYTLFSFLL